MLKSSLSIKYSISIEVCSEEDKAILAFSQASNNLFTTLGFLNTSNPVLFLNSAAQYSKSL